MATYLDAVLPECRVLIQGYLRARADRSRYARACRTTLAEVTRARLLPSQSIPPQWTRLLYAAANDDTRVCDFVDKLVGINVCAGTISCHTGQPAVMLHASHNAGVTIRFQPKRMVTLEITRTMPGANWSAVETLSIEKALATLAKIFPAGLNTCTHCLTVK
jgi:hypothetical protein